MKGSLAKSLIIGALATATVSAGYGAEDDIETVTMFAADTVLDKVTDDLRNNRVDAANQQLTTIIKQQLDNLTPAQQHRALQLEAATAIERREFARALTLAQRASEMTQNVLIDWVMRLQAGTLTQQYPDSIASLTRIAAQWPSELNKLTLQLMQLQLREAFKLTDSHALYNLLLALHDADYKFSDGSSSDGLWYSLTLLMLEQGNTESAKNLVLDIHSTRQLLAMRVDKRFDTVVKANPELFDVKRAAAAEVEEWQNFIRQHPRSLLGVQSLINALIMTRQYEQAVTVADAALAKISRSTAKKPAFDDQERSNWLGNARARALRQLGRWDEAVAQLRTSSETLENGQPNVSQLLNLASLQIAVERPQEALATLKRLDTSTSPYGRMVMEQTRHSAALQMKDRAEQERSKAYIIEHRDDAPSIYAFALLEEGQLEAAAQNLIRDLNDPKQRAETLLRLQKYNSGAATPYSLERKAANDALMARDDVQNAIQQYGTIEYFDINAPEGI